MPKSTILVPQRRPARLVHAIVAVLAVLTVSPVVRSGEAAYSVSRSLARRVERVSPVSESFAQEMEFAAETIPEEIWRRVSEAGWRVCLAEQVVDVVPGLRGTAPRGWPDGTVWDNTDAVHLPATKQLVIAEKRRNQQGLLVACTRVAGVLRHELGHAFDMISGDGQQFRSATAVFLAAYHADLARMSAEQRQELAYYLQQQEAGRQEAFAEAFGIVFGGGSDIARQELFETCFVDTIQFVRHATSPPASQSSPPASLSSPPAAGQLPADVQTTDAYESEGESTQRTRWSPFRRRR
jgi:hypothetical protein